MHPIDHNKPLTPFKPGRPRTYPWYEMTVGDSFFVDRLVNYSGWGRKLARRFVSRRTTENGTKGFRIYRLT